MTHRGTAPLGHAVELHRGWLYWLYHVEGGEEAAVGGGFLFQGEGVGSGGGGHAVEAHRTAFEIEFGIFPGGRWGGAEGLAEGVGGFFSGGDNGLALRDLPQQGGDVGRGHYLQELVGGVVFQAADGGGGVVHRYAGSGAEIHYVIQSEFLGGNVHETVLVVEKYQAQNPPHVVDEIRVVKIYAPALGLGRETAQHQHLGISRQEWLERMPLNGNWIAVWKRLVCV